jgi:uncharacterized membrane protein
MKATETSGCVERLPGIDLLRGLAMVLMALDHARDSFGDIRLTPENLATTTPLLFATRFVTHFCAPVFVLLAGVSAALMGARRTPAELSRFLLARGVWLVVLEFTLVYYAWMLSFELGFVFLQVIAAIGCAMLVLAGALHLPAPLRLALALALVAGHDLLGETSFGASSAVGKVLSGALQFVSIDGTPRVLVIYPLLPWTGVLLLGHALGPLFARERRARRRALALLGCAATALFVVLRLAGWYGDPAPFAAQLATLEEAGRATFALRVVAFLNCAKYPPSLLYLLMTLGPALLLLACVDRRPGPVGRAFVVYGRVPLFYYVLHIFVIHLAARALYWLRHGEPVSPVRTAFQGNFPPWLGNGLGTVYVAWAAVVLALYPACRWYAGVKRRGRSAVWAYL